uniref:Rav1p_C domain-containing protein n=1 Tax=Parastrongyloides trichosuri TaxID=131310 RepID=A0A0N4ZCX6_PARTI
MNQHVVTNRDGTIDWSDGGKIVMKQDDGKKVFYRKDLEITNKQKIVARDKNDYETSSRNVGGNYVKKNDVDMQLSCIGNVRKIFYKNNVNGNINKKLNPRQNIYNRYTDSVTVYLNLSDILSITKNYDHENLQDIRASRSVGDINEEEDLFFHYDSDEIFLAVSPRAEMLVSIINYRDTPFINLGAINGGRTDGCKKRLLRICNLELSGLERIIEDSCIRNCKKDAGFFGIFYKTNFYTNLTFDDKLFKYKSNENSGLYMECAVDIVSLQQKLHFSFFINYVLSRNWENSTKGANIIRPFENGVLFNTTDCLIIFTFSNNDIFTDEKCCCKQNNISHYRKYQQWLIFIENSDFNYKEMVDGSEISAFKIKHLKSYCGSEKNENINIICRENVVNIRKLLIDLIHVIYRKQKEIIAFYSLDDFQVDLINLCEIKKNIFLHITALHRALVNNRELTYNVIKFHAIFDFNLVLIKSTLLSCVRLSNTQARDSKFWYSNNNIKEICSQTEEAHVFDNSTQFAGRSKKFLVPYYQNIILAL